MVLEPVRSIQTILTLASSSLTTSADDYEIYKLPVTLPTASFSIFCCFQDTQIYTGNTSPLLLSLTKILTKLIEWKPMTWINLDDFWANLPIPLINASPTAITPFPRKCHFFLFFFPVMCIWCCCFFCKSVKNIYLPICMKQHYCIKRLRSICY